MMATYRSKPYIQALEQAYLDNLPYFQEITESLWGYWGETPKTWMGECLKKARTYLITCDNKQKNKRQYKDYKRFFKNQLLLRFQWERPQEYKTYITNQQEKQYYKRKESE